MGPARFIAKISNKIPRVDLLHRCHDRGAKLKNSEFSPVIERQYIEIPFDPWHCLNFEVKIQIHFFLFLFLEREVELEHCSSMNDSVHGWKNAERNSSAQDLVFKKITSLNFYISFPPPRPSSKSERTSEFLSDILPADVRNSVFFGDFRERIIARKKN